MNKTKLIPFDLERWRAGDFKRVVTKGGQEISELTYFKSATEDTYPLVGVLENEVQSWAIDGTFLNIERSLLLNLVLEVEYKTLEGWVNVFADFLGGTVFSSKEQAMKFSSDTSKYVTTIHITYNDNN
jgi:hypothetical protein